MNTFTVGGDRADIELHTGAVAAERAAHREWQAGFGERAGLGERREAPAGR
jgi:hypothetical protein